MKYMGSKRSMLQNGLGELLLNQARKHDRFVDLFAGGGVVSWFIAEQIDQPVLSIDLQRYSTVLCESVISRTKSANPESLFSEWVNVAKKKRDRSNLWKESIKLSSKELSIHDFVDQARELCGIKSRIGPIWNAYGGHYFSPAQAITFDYLINNLPASYEEKMICLAACISTASECAASPGHTAQPFQPTSGAGKFILDSWRKDPLQLCKKNLDLLCPRYAKIRGSSITSDCQTVISQLSSTDLVFIDPPYSGVQYSRFYHVLEVIARCEKDIFVSGVGRYPTIKERPQSKFSNISQAKEALRSILLGIAEKGSTIVFTFPSGKSSNGLSGDYVKSVASDWFLINDCNKIEGKFSTLGGNNGNRKARNDSSELILLMTPK